MPFDSNSWAILGGVNYKYYISVEKGFDELRTLCRVSIYRSKCWVRDLTSLENGTLLGCLLEKYGRGTRGGYE